MADLRVRRERLLALLPRIFTAQPSSSAVGALIDSMAASLGRVDDTLTRIQYDRWVGLASAQLPTPDEASALEGLGRLLQVTRLPPRVRHAGYNRSPGEIAVRFDHAAPLSDALDELVGSGWRRSQGGQPPDDPAALLAARFDGLRFVLDDTSQGLTAAPDPAAPPETAPAALARFQGVLDPEPGETFRQRLLITARVRTGGLTTPRALLSLAIADLGAEPCPRLERRQDATLAFGMPPGTRKRCAGCSGRDAAAPCPSRAQAVVEAWITENPTLAARHVEPSPRLRRVFTVTSASLHPDRPVVTLGVRDQPAPYPALRSLDSGEITLYAGTLQPGDTLVLYPAVSPAETAPFDGFDAPGHHAWATAHPAGRAVLINSEGHERDVSNSIFYLWGNRLDDRGAAFGSMRCGVLEQRVLTPRIAPGANGWMLLTFAQPDAAFAGPDDTVHASRFAGHDDLDGTRFALLDGTIGEGDARYASVLLESFNKTDTGGTTETDTAHTPRLSLRLDWMTRPPASIRLRIPRNEWVAAAAARGALPLLRDDIARATAAGVRASVDFPEPTRRDAHDGAERLGLAASQRWTEDAAPADGALRFTLATTLRDVHDSADGQFSAGGVFDTTRLDWSHSR